jgi:lipopolysaccharide/colanic/teichoic acid biosynthesis glycosyltransferase
MGVLVAVTSRGPVIFRQLRTGQNGRGFWILKFRTMIHGHGGEPLTRDGDCRITRVGRHLRRWKLDEIPQLINVLKGDMSLVGPRPDLPEIWSKANSSERKLLALKPGVTGAASLVFRDEETLLAQAPAGQLTDFYLYSVLPSKARIDLDYAAQATLRTDFTILSRTLCAALRPKSATVVKSAPLNEQLSR